MFLEDTLTKLVVVKGWASFALTVAHSNDEPLTSTSTARGLIHWIIDVEASESRREFAQEFVCDLLMNEEALLGIADLARDHAGRSSSSLWFANVFNTTPVTGLTLR